MILYLKRPLIFCPQYGPQRHTMLSEISTIIFSGKNYYNVVDSNLLSSPCVFKVLLEFLSLINFSNNFHSSISLLYLLKSNLNTSRN